MRTREGEVLTGLSPQEIVRQLHKMSLAPCSTDAEFRQQMAGRAGLQCGERVRWDTDENFIADLVKVGLLIDE